MPLTHEPFERFAGDTWKFQAELNDDIGADLDLTGATVEWVLHDAASGSAVLTLTLGDGLAISGDPTEGKVIIIVTAEQSALAPGTYYDITRAELASGIVTTQAMGLITVIESPALPAFDWDAVDFDDPCGTLAKLRPKFYSVVQGGTIAKVRFGDEEVTYSSSNFAAFDQLIRDLEEQCAKKQGTPRRFAMRLGARLR